MVLFEYEGSLKMLRETLCRAQNAIGNQAYGSKAQKERDIKNLQILINEVDHHRPLGIDGKHGNLHTETCDCEDKGPQWSWGTVRRIS